MAAIPITNQNLHQVAASLDLDAQEIEQKLYDSKYEYKKQQDFQYTLDFFNADETWHANTKQKIKKISANLPKGLSRKEIIIKLYGWIEHDTKISGSLSIPYEENVAYSKAYCISLVFNGFIDKYDKLLSWD